MEPKMQPDGEWGAVKVGAGTPPVRTEYGWLLVYHGIDTLPGHEDVERPAMQYRERVAFLDIVSPHILSYRSPQPVFWPELPQEREGIVDDVVFPTAIDIREDVGKSVYDVYYGMGDYSIGRGRLEVFSDAAESLRSARDADAIRSAAVATVREQ